MVQYYQSTDENQNLNQTRGTMRMANEKKTKKRSTWPVRFIIVLIIFSIGVMVGIHRRVILAWIKGEALPEMPEGHCCPCADLLKRFKKK